LLPDKEEMPPSPGGDEEGPPVTQKGIVFLEPTSWVEVEIASPPAEPNIRSEGESKWDTPSHTPSPPPGSQQRPLSIETPISEPPRAARPPVTVETVTDRSNGVDLCKRGGLDFKAVGDSYLLGMSAGYMEPRYDRFCLALFNPQVPDENFMGTHEDENTVMAALLNTRSMRRP